MGIRELLPLIKKSAPHLLRNLPHPTTLAGARLAVDGHMLLHRFWYAPKPGAHPLGPTGQPNHHVQYFYNFLELCDYLHVRPTIVFDYGVRPFAKQRVAHKQRAVARSRQLELHGTAVKTVDGLDVHLDKLTETESKSAADPREFYHLPDDPLETEELRELEQVFRRRENHEPLQPLQRDHFPEQSLESDEARLLEQAFLRTEREHLQVPDKQPETDVALAHLPELSWQDAPDSLDTPPATASPPCTLLEIPSPTGAFLHPPTPPETPLESPSPVPSPTSFSMADLTSLQSFLGHLIVSTSRPVPPQHRASSPFPLDTLPANPQPPSSTLPTPDPVAALNDIKLPRTNIHRLLADTLVATTSPAFDPLHSLSSARTQAQKESQRLERTSAGLPSFAMYDVLLLLRARGVPTVLTPNLTEAEQVCGALAHMGVVDFAVSDDSDTGVFFPDALVLRNFFQYNKRPLVLGPLGELASALGLVPPGSAPDKVKAALVDFSILAGCDYSTKIPGIGPMNAIKLLKQYGTIDAMMQARPDLLAKVQDDPSWDPQEARAVFNNEYLDTDVVLELVNEAAEVVDWPLTRADHRVPDVLANCSFWSPGMDITGAPTEVQVLETMGIRPFDPETYVQNLMALEPQL